MRAIRADGLLPQSGRAIDAFFALLKKSSVRLSHSRRKYGQQDVAVVRLAERILQRFKAIRRRFERRVQDREALERVPETFTGDAKIVKSLLVATLEAGGERFDLALTRLHHALHDAVEVATAVQVDSFRFHGR